MGIRSLKRIRRQTNRVTQAFEQEVAAFERMKATLLMQYEGQYVAIYQGEVIANGEEKLKLLDEVRAQQLVLSFATSKKSPLIPLEQFVCHLFMLCAHDTL